MVVQLVDNKRWEYAAELYSKDYMTKSSNSGRKPHMSCYLQKIHKNKLRILHKFCLGSEVNVGYVLFA